MAQYIDDFGKSLEDYEIAKLIKKYTELGYRIKRSRTRPFYLYRRPDLHMINPVNQDEIIFEIKSKYNYQEKDSTRQRLFYRNYFPNARFILVVAKEEEPVSFESSAVKKLLFDLILSDYKEEFEKVFKGNHIQFEAVDYFECTSVDFGNFSTIKLQGEANITFWISLNDDTFKGSKLTEGIPFNFDLKIAYNSNNEYLYEVNKGSTTLKFDFS